MIEVRSVASWITMGSQRFEASDLLQDTDGPLYLLRSFNKMTKLLPHWHSKKDQFTTTEKIKK
jgi:hypothetical protein